MFDYRMVMSIHDQKMQEYRAQAERDRMARKAGQRMAVRLFRFVAQRIRAASRVMKPREPRIARFA